MSNINAIFLEGRATRPLEMKQTQKGTDAIKVNFVTNVNTGRKDENGKMIVLPEYYVFDLYGTQAKAVFEHLADKGRLNVRGVHKSRAYLGKDGNPYVENKVYQPVVTIVDFKKSNANAASEEASLDDLPTVELNESDLPF